ncbi:MAG: hypothetical protein LBH39_01530 [Clostridiales Family XIII bacterium]|jgi:hypothetical protein|nr:hypothetical protein [Clostridiales Family XIII bacterium]
MVKYACRHRGTRLEGNLTASWVARRRYRDYYFENIYSGNLIDASIGALMRIYGSKILDEIEMGKCTDEAIETIIEYKGLYNESESKDGHNWDEEVFMGIKNL